jgi:hypothetical protein
MTPPCPSAFLSLAALSAVLFAAPPSESVTRSRPAKAGHRQ